MFPVFQGGQAPFAHAHHLFSRISFSTYCKIIVALALIIFSASCIPAVAKNLEGVHARPGARSPVAPGANFKPAHQRPKLFKSLALKTNAPRASSPFVSVLKTIETEKKFYRDCDASRETCPAHLLKWRERMRELRNLTGYAQIARLNAELNGLAKYKTDLNAFGRNDFWASPAQMLKNGGDCEDFAILKYVSLRELGYSQDALRLVIVRDTKREAGHAIVTVLLNGKIFALDSLMDEPATATEIAHYSPVYSLSATQRWLHVTYKKRVLRKHSASKPHKSDSADSVQHWHHGTNQNKHRHTDNHQGT